MVVLLETGILGRSPSPTACVEAADIAQRELEEIDAAKLKAPEDQLWFLSLVSFQVSEDFMDITDITSKGAESCHLRMNKPSLITLGFFPPQSQASC